MTSPWFMRPFRRELYPSFRISDEKKAVEWVVDDLLGEYFESKYLRRIQKYLASRGIEVHPICNTCFDGGAVEISGVLRPAMYTDDYILPTFTTEPLSPKDFAETWKKDIYAPPTVVIALTVIAKVRMKEDRYKVTGQVRSGLVIYTEDYRRGKICSSLECLKSSLPPRRENLTAIFNRSFFEEEEWEEYARDLESSGWRVFDYADPASLELEVKGPTLIYPDSRDEEEKLLRTFWNTKDVYFPLMLVHPLDLSQLDFSTNSARRAEVPS